MFSYCIKKGLRFLTPRTQHFLDILGVYGLVFTVTSCPDSLFVNWKYEGANVSTHVMWLDVKARWIIRWSSTCLQNRRLHFVPAKSMYNIIVYMTIFCLGLPLLQRSQKNETFGFFEMSEISIWWLRYESWRSCKFIAAVPTDILVHFGIG